MGVYGNLAIAAMLFCGRWMIGPGRWNAGLLKTSFWSLNIGLALMGVMDLFPVGIHQLMVAMSDGYAFSRSAAYIHSAFFQQLTWLRGVGVLLFVAGGVLPLVWFMVTRWFSLKAPQTAEEIFVVPPSVLAIAAPLGVSPAAPAGLPLPASRPGIVAATKRSVPANNEPVSTH
jgi:nitric oxide reductase subunit B